eukprot:c12760_g1_i5.p1 GENE.c12760_g1_i5~~c12760_g1_i5.p1  ORF type:complete len:284 (+),score=29.37 c12760_g1_i5:365-1216(+)
MNQLCWPLQSARSLFWPCFGVQFPISILWRLLFWKIFLLNKVRLTFCFQLANFGFVGEKTGNYNQPPNNRSRKPLVTSWVRLSLNIAQILQIIVVSHTTSVLPLSCASCFPLLPTPSLLTDCCTIVTWWPSTLAQLPRLTYLNISENWLGSAIFKELSPVLAQLTRLTYLNLMGNSIEAEGMQSLAPAIANMTQLTDLDVSGNGLGVHGAKHLAVALHNVHLLTSLNLCGNMFEQEGISHLLPCFLQMPHLMCLNLDYNHTTLEAEQQLRHMLPHVKDLFAVW